MSNQGKYMKKAAHSQKRKKARWDGRRIVSAVIAGVLVVTLLGGLVVNALIYALAVTQEEIDAMQAQADALQDEIDSLDEQLSALSDETSTQEEEKSRLEQKIGVLTQEIAAGEELVEQYNALIQENETQLAEAQAEEELQRERFAQQVREDEEGGSLTLLSVLLQSNSVVDFLSRLGFVNDVSAYRQSVIHDLETAISEVKKLTAQLEDTLAVQETAVAELESQKAQLEEDEAAIDQVLVALASQYDDYEEEMMALASSADNLDAEIAAAEAKYQKQLDALKKKEEEERKAEEAKVTVDSDTDSDTDTDPDPGSEGGTTTTTSTASSYAFPLTTYTRISSYFGYRTRPTAGASTNHKGLDLAAPKGTSILASKAGVVTYVGYESGGYGYWVQITHTDGSQTRYAHMLSRANVSAGDTVSQGQVIGYVGMTGAATGYHLHFEIRINSTPVDPYPYLFS